MMRKSPDLTKQERALLAGGQDAGWHGDDRWSGEGPGVRVSESGFENGGTYSIKAVEAIGGVSFIRAAFNLISRILNTHPSRHPPNHTCRVFDVLAMGGGTSLWASPDYKSDPRSIFNTRLAYLSTLR